MAPVAENGGEGRAPLLLALVPRPQQASSVRPVGQEHFLSEHLGRATSHLADLRGAAQDALGGLKRAFDDAVALLPPQLRVLFPHELHTRARQVTSRARISRPSPLRAHNFATLIPGDSVAELVVTRGLSNFFSLYNTLLIVRIICTWFPEAPRAIVNPISTVCDPYLNLFRGIIPPLGGTLDFSPILAFLLLDAFTNAASALPAELPRTNTEGSTWRQQVQHRKGDFHQRKSSP